MAHKLNATLAQLESLSSVDAQILTIDEKQKEQNTKLNKLERKISVLRRDIVILTSIRDSIIAEDLDCGSLKQPKFVIS